jgi:predicted oxidoreductase (fatty acid repression mutant protein)
MALFGRVVALGALLLLVCWAVTRTFEREFALGYAALLVASVVATGLAQMDAWVSCAGMILKL